MSTQEKIVIMQAFLDGKEIECQFPGRNVHEHRVWEKLGKEPSWDWGRNNYRIKTTPPVTLEQGTMVSYQGETWEVELDTAKSGWRISVPLKRLDP